MGLGEGGEERTLLAVEQPHGPATRHRKRAPCPPGPGLTGAVALQSVPMSHHCAVLVKLIQHCTPPITRDKGRGGEAAWA